MLKKSKVIYVIGTLIVSVVSMLVVMLTMAASGAAVSSGRKLTFVSGSADFTYDGTEHKSGEWKLLSGELKKGHKAEVTVGGWRTEAGESPNFLSVKIVNENGKDVSATYNIECLSGVINVKKRPIKLASKAAKKDYDGTAISDPTVEIAEGSLVEGHTLEATATGSVSEYGSCENVFDAKIKAADGTDVTSNYEIEKKFGRLEIIKKSLTVKSGSNTQVYDGTPLRENSKEVEGELAEGHRVVCEFGDGVTDVTDGVDEDGKGNNKFTCKVIDGSGNDVTDNYDIFCVFGNLKVTPRPILITAKSASKAYDGKPLVCNEYTIEPADALVSGHEAVVTIIGSNEGAAGSYVNKVFSVEIKSGDKDVTYNYDVKTRDGSLVIEKKKENGAFLDDSGGLGGGGISDGNVVLAEIISNRTGRLYLRYKSFGDYTGKGWGEANPYEGRLINDGNVFYSTAELLKNAGLSTYTATIKSYGNYYLTYYPLIGDKHSVQQSDVEFTGNTDAAYSFDYVSFDYLSQADKIGEYKVNSGFDANWDSDYADFVRANYLYVPDSTKVELRKIIDREGLSKDDIPKLVRYVKTAAKYNLEYDESMDSENDVVIAFLEKYKQGVCRHYASAGVLLLRTLGIPARYVGGCVADVKANELTEVTGDKGHAWVEMYAEGFGWVILDVTGGSGGGTGGGSGDIPENPDDPQNPDDESKKKLTVKPAFEDMKYDGYSTLKPSGKIDGFDKWAKMGYKYKAIVVGSRFEIGISESEIIDLTIFDKDDNDVTDEFSLTFKKGKLHVYATEITITSETVTKTYDGTPLADDGAPTVSGSMFVGHKLANVRRLHERSEAGVTVNSFEFSITDENGDDVSVNYKINYEWGALVVKAKEITVTAASADKVYDGTALSANDYKVEGKLIDGHRIAEVEVEGEQTEIGKSDNRIGKVVILDENGNDVTKNYAIKCVNGKLVVKR